MGHVTYILVYQQKWREKGVDRNEFDRFGKERTKRQTDKDRTKWKIVITDNVV